MEKDIKTSTFVWGIVIALAVLILVIWYVQDPKETKPMDGGVEKQETPLVPARPFDIEHGKG